MNRPIEGKQYVDEEVILRTPESVLTNLGLSNASRKSVNNTVNQISYSQTYGNRRQVTCVLPVKLPPIVWVFPEPVWPYAKHVAKPCAKMVFNNGCAVNLKHSRHAQRFRVKYTTVSKCILKNQKTTANLPLNNLWQLNRWIQFLSTTESLSFISPTFTEKDPFSTSDRFSRKQSRRSTAHKLIFEGSTVQSYRIDKYGNIAQLKITIAHYHVSSIKISFA